MAISDSFSVRRVHTNHIDHHETGSGLWSEDEDDEDEIVYYDAKAADEKALIRRTKNRVSTHHVTDSPVNERKLFYYHVGKTVTCVCVWIWVGVMHTAFFTCLLDFEERLHVSLEQIGKLISAITVTGVAGHIAGATFREYLRLNELLLLSLFTFTNTLACLIKAWSSSLLMLGIGGCLDSFCSGVTSSVCHPMIMGIWGDHAASPIHAMHFGWSLGAVIAPLITRPFLSIPCPSPVLDALPPNIDQAHINEKTMTTSQPHDTNEEVQLANCSLANVTNHTIYIRESSIEIPLSIPAIPLFIVAVIFLSFFIFERTSRGKSWRTVRMDEKKTTTNCVESVSSGISFRFVVIITSLLTYFYFLWVGISGVLGGFLFTLTVKLPLGFTKDDAAVAFSVYYMCFSGGRFLAIAISHCVSIKKMLPTEICGTLLTMIGWVVLGVTSRKLYWFFMCLFGLISAPVWPGGITWTDRYIVYTAVTCAIMELGVGAGSGLYVWLAGKLIGNGEPQYFLYLVLGLNVHIAVIMLIMMCMVRKRGDRHAKELDLGVTTSTLDETEVEPCNSTSNLDYYMHTSVDDESNLLPANSAVDDT